MVLMKLISMPIELMLKAETIPADRADENDKYGNDSNSSSEEVFDEGS